MTENEIIQLYQKVSVSDFKKSIVAFYHAASKDKLYSLCESFNKIHESDKARIKELEQKIEQL